MIRASCVAVLVSTLVATIAPLSAQGVDSRPVHFGVMGGVSIPLGLMSDASQTGWNAGALVSIGFPGSPLSLRIDGNGISSRGTAAATRAPSASSPARDFARSPSTCV